jgi:glycerol uptake facilitator-like aquaporin
MAADNARAAVPLGRCVVAEAVGTGLLVAIVVGSGIFAQRLSPGAKGLQLLENSTATALGLMALILALGAVSGAHFNPVVTLADWLLGGIDSRRAGAYVAAQIVGGCLGTVVANLMFDLPAVEWAATRRSGTGLWLGEVVATFGLLMVILGVVRCGRSTAAPFAVGGYIGAAYWFTSSTSFANPAVTLARTLTDTFAGILPASVPMFVVAQVVGALAAVGLAVYLYPGLPSLADRVVLPHDLSDPVLPEGASVHAGPERS